MDCCRVCGAHTYHANGQMCNRKKEQEMEKREGALPPTLYCAGYTFPVPRFHVGTAWGAM